MTLTARLAASMIALVAAAATAIGWMNYHNLEQALLLRVFSITLRRILALLPPVCNLT